MDDYTWPTARSDASCQRAGTEAIGSDVDSQSVKTATTVNQAVGCDGAN
jgi:hypothetical protein